MKTFKTGLAGWLALSALALSACLSDRFNGCPSDDGAGGGGDAHVRVWLQMPSAAPKSYAITEIDENEVTAIDVMAFHAVTVDAQHPSGWAYAYRAQGTAIADAPGVNPIKAKKQFTVTLVKNPAEQTFVVLANVRNEVNALGEIAVGADKNALLARLVSSSTGKWNASEAAPDFRPFPMWGELKAIIDDASTEIPGSGKSIGMLRGIARIDAILSGEALTDDNFEMKEFYLYNSKNRGYIVPAPASMESDVFKVKAATVPSVAVEYEAWNNGLPLAYDIPAAMKSAFERTVYLYEAKAAAQDKSSEATCIVVGGIYDTDTDPTYYRLDFFQADGITYKDVLRNHHYRINIVKVEGRGYDTPDEAFNSKSINMKFEVIDWNDGEMSDIIVYGPKYITLKNSRNENRDDRTAVLYRNDGSTDVIVFSTNIPLDDFVMALSHGGNFPNPSDKTLIENDRFRVELKTESGINFLEFTSLLPYGTSANPSTLTITAGQIQFNITLLQKDADSGDWMDGGDYDKDF